MRTFPPTLMNSVHEDVGAQYLLPRRQRLHTRKIVIEAFERDDGLFDLEAHLTDVKDHDLDLASGVRSAGSPVHDMSLRLTINRSLDVVDAAAGLTEMPYPGACDAIAPAYRHLVGLNLLKNFKKQVMTLLGGTGGCTHMSELAAVLPTAAVQAFAGRIDAADGAKPFQLDRCHALASSTDTVRKYYPTWYESGTGRLPGDGGG